MWEEHRLLGEHRHPALVGGDEDTGGGVSENPVAEHDPGVVGSQQPGDQGQQRRLACAVRAQDREHIPAGELEVEFGAALGQAGLESKAAHSVPANRRDAEAMTMAAATTISSSDSAMAASGSVSR